MLSQTKIKNKVLMELFIYYFMSDTTELFCGGNEGCFASIEYLRVK